MFFDEGDFYIFCDFEWMYEVFFNGFVLFDFFYNIVVVLGLCYFGELKKVILMFVWVLGSCNGFIVCYGGMK